MNGKKCYDSEKIKKLLEYIGFQLYRTDSVVDFENNEFPLDILERVEVPSIYLKPKQVIYV